MYSTEDLRKNRALNRMKGPIITTIIKDPTKMAGAPMDPKTTVRTPCINNSAQMAGDYTRTTHSM